MAASLDLVGYASHRTPCHFRQGAVRDANPRYKLKSEPLKYYRDPLTTTDAHGHQGVFATCAVQLAGRLGGDGKGKRPEQPMGRVAGLWQSSKICKSPVHTRVSHTRVSNQSRSNITAIP